MKAPVIRQNKPRSVIVAVWLIYLAVFLTGVFLVFDILINAAYGYGVVLIEFLPEIITLVVLAVLAYFIASGRRLARLIYIVLMCLPALLFIVYYLADVFHIVTFSIPLFITSFTHLLTVILLITPSANVWFKRENKKTTEPHNSESI